MQTHKTIVITFLLSILLIANKVSAESAQLHTLQQLSDSWAEASFGTINSDKKSDIQSALNLAETALTDFSDDPEVLAWAGIIKASYAGTQSGMTALKQAKRARKLLLRAMELNPEALNGGARSTLGVLYYKVPPWPIGFGNKDKAEVLLKESAVKYPTSLNAQYFYAEYLIEQKQKTEAKRLFNNALKIPVRPTHKLVDTARIAQINNYLASNH